MRYDISWSKQSDKTLEEMYVDVRLQDVDLARAITRAVDTFESRLKNDPEQQGGEPVLGRPGLLHIYIDPLDFYYRIFPEEVTVTDFELDQWPHWRSVFWDSN